MISRDEYLNVLKRFKDKALIKVITGIRRCGKSTLLEMFQDYLKENGVEESQIISIKSPYHILVVQKWHITVSARR